MFNDQQRIVPSIHSSFWDTKLKISILLRNCTCCHKHSWYPPSTTSQMSLSWQDTVLDLSFKGEGFGINFICLSLEPRSDFDSSEPPWKIHTLSQRKSKNKPRQPYDSNTNTVILFRKTQCGELYSFSPKIRKHYETRPRFPILFFQSTIETDQPNKKPVFNHQYSRKWKLLFSNN